MKPVLPYTWRGKLLVGILQFLYSILSVFKGKKWSAPLKDFEENPLNMSKQKEELLYFGYKYYYKPPTRFSRDSIAYFEKQTLDFTPPAGFISENQITLTAGGDLMPYSWIQKEYTQHLWDEVGDFFFGADIVFANLETPIVADKAPAYVPEVMLNDMLFNGSEEMFDIFSGNGKYKGYDILSTANNHSWDMGEEGVIETLNFLDKRKIAFTGTARNWEERNQVPIVERNGIKIAFIAYTYSLNKFCLPTSKEYAVNHVRLNRKNEDLGLIKKDVLNAKNKGADLVVLAAHVGNAYQPLPSPETVALYHRIFRECGVDIILGTHPHNAQPMEKYSYQCPFSNEPKQGFAIYSLGDFVAYDIFVWGKVIPLLKLTIEKGKYLRQSHTQITHVEVLPIYNWGSKDISNGREMRFLDFYKTIEQVEKGQAPEFMTAMCRKELTELRTFWEKYFITRKTEKTHAVPH